MTGNGTGWVPTREAQRKALTIPHTGMAVVTDAGDNRADRSKLSDIRFSGREEYS